MSRIFVVRHPPVLDPKLCYGRLDVPLASEDETLATLAENFSAWREEGAWGKRPLTLRSSPRTRCRFVANWLSRELELPVIVDNELAEMDFGHFEGNTFAELGKDEVFQRFMTEWLTAKAPGGESVPEFEARIEGCLHSFVARSRAHAEPRDELWIAHSGTIRALWVLLEGKTWLEAMATPVPFLSPFAFTLSCPSAFEI